ncbi:hypothetical protein ACOMHN_028568 [Nucella lapillus]
MTAVVGWGWSAVKVLSMTAVVRWGLSAVKVFSMTAIVRWGWSAVKVLSVTAVVGWGWSAVKVLSVTAVGGWGWSVREGLLWTAVVRWGWSVSQGPLYDSRCGMGLECRDGPLCDSRWGMRLECREGPLYDSRCGMGLECREGYDDSPAADGGSQPHSHTTYPPAIDDANVPLDLKAPQWMYSAAESFSLIPVPKASRLMLGEMATPAALMLGEMAAPSALMLGDAQKAPSILLCGLCDKSFTSASGLSRHKRCVHSARSLPYVCSVCGRGFHDKETHEGHLNRHNNVKAYQCSRCRRQFTYKTSLYHHVRNSTTCAREGSDTYLIKRASSSRPPQWPQNTLPHPHPNSAASETDDDVKPFQPQATTAESYEQDYYTGDDSLIDPTLPPGSAVAGYTDYYPTHPHPKQSRTCPICGKWFDRREYFQDHMNMHNKFKAHRCSNCLSAFTYKRNLWQHIRDGVCRKRKGF